MTQEKNQPDIAELARALSQVIEALQPKNIDQKAYAALFEGDGPTAEKLHAAFPKLSQATSDDAKKSA